VRPRWGIATDAPLALYTGTFEAYQGVDLLIDACVHLARHVPTARVLVVGGDPGQVEAARRRAREAGVGEMLAFTGQQPAREIPSYVAACDVLVSPRIRGTNTPLKIYSYLRSGKAIIATKLLTHTQVLSPETARLVSPTPEAFADAMVSLLGDPVARESLARQAREVADRKYSRQVYLQRTAAAYARLGVPASAAEASA
jgi:glycosyltransferase involved in cell wall biosynthesis